MRERLNALIAAAALVIVPSIALAQSTTPTTTITGSWHLNDPANLFGQGSSITLDQTTAAIQMQSFDTDTDGHVDSFTLAFTPTAAPANNWQINVALASGDLTNTSYVVDGASILTNISFGNGTATDTCGGGEGTLSISSYTENAAFTSALDRISSVSGQFAITCANVEANLTGSFQYTATTSTTGGGGGGGTGGGGTGGGSGSGGTNLPPSFPGSPIPLPVPLPGPGPSPIAADLSVVTPGVTVTSAALPLSEGSLLPVSIQTIPNSTFNSPVNFLATSSAPGLTFAFSPATIAAPGLGTSKVSVGTNGQVVPGNYQVTIIAQGGGVRATTSFNVLVYCDPPFILGTDQPQGAFVTRGDVAHLSVVANGSGPLHYQWFNGHAGSTAFPLPQGTDPTFTTSGINDTTDYWVRVSNNCGSVDSQTVTVGVAGSDADPGRRH